MILPTNTIKPKTTDKDYTSTSSFVVTKERLSLQCKKVNDEDVDDIVVFAINVNKLDPKLLEPDPHVKWDKNPQEISTHIYRGQIPPSAFLNASDIKNGGGRKY